MVHCIQPWCFFNGIRLVVESGREESCDCQQVPLSRWQCGGWGQPGQGGALGSPGAPEGGAFVRNPRWEPTAHAGAKLVLARWSSLVEHLVLRGAGHQCSLHHFWADRWKPSPTEESPQPWEQWLAQTVNSTQRCFVFIQPDVLCQTIKTMSWGPAKFWERLSIS